MLTDDLVLPLSSLAGAELLIQTARTYAGQLTLLCLGPLSNVALALQREPHLGSLLRQVFFMGGVSRIFWPDWNVRSYARAAQCVLTPGLPVTMIGWNVTVFCHMRSGDVERMYRATSTRLHLLSRLISAWQEHQPWWRGNLPGLHDPLVVAALCAPQFFRFTSLPVRVLTQGPLAGWTIPLWSGGSTVRTALSVECEMAYAWMLQRWFSTERRS